MRHVPSVYFQFSFVVTLLILLGFSSLSRRVAIRAFYLKTSVASRSRRVALTDAASALCSSSAAAPRPPLLFSFHSWKACSPRLGPRLQREHSTGHSSAAVGASPVTVLLRLGAKRYAWRDISFKDSAWPWSVTLRLGRRGWKLTC